MSVTLPVSKGTGWLNEDADSNMAFMSVTPLVSQPVRSSSKLASEPRRPLKSVTASIVQVPTAPQYAALAEVARSDPAYALPGGTGEALEMAMCLGMFGVWLGGFAERNCC